MEAPVAAVLPYCKEANPQPLQPNAHTLHTKPQTLVAKP